ncbi:MAG: hypothetical protein L7W94_02425 [Alphaproteobacteria bacterium]|nr:hypothetical protein [Alphaproteobacteria bacterium]
MTSADTPTVMMDKLAEAAWVQLADMSPRALHIDEIAAAAGIAPSAARAVSGSITALILHQLERLNRQAVLESLADIEDAGEVPIRDKIMEALMHRFEVYAPHRAQMIQLESAARRDPVLGLRLVESLFQATRMLLRMAGDDLAGFRGEARVRGVAGVAMVVARVWRTDDTPDLSMTLKEIDKRLATAEEWGRTFRVLDGRPPSDGEDGNAGGIYDPGDQGPVENGPGGRYQ